MDKLDKEIAEQLVRGVHRGFEDLKRNAPGTQLSRVSLCSYSRDPGCPFINDTVDS